MTAFGAIRSGKTPRGGNIKDGGHFNRQLNQNKEFCSNGFTRNDWNKWNYTWKGKFPIFLLAPGIIEAKAGLVAYYEPGDIKILFPYGTLPTDIKARLDDEILAIMRHDADTQTTPLYEPAGVWIPF